MLIGLPIMHSPAKLTIVDTATVLNLEEEENSAHTCTMVSIPVVLSDIYT